MKCSECNTENPETARFCSGCGTPLQPKTDAPTAPTKTLFTPLKELTRGTTFAKRYDIIEEVGRGGMGQVYRAWDKNINEEVALKILNPEIGADEKMVERFRNELKLARKITHKNVCRMYDLNQERGNLYISMEYVSGEDLRSLIRRIGQFTVGKTIIIAKQICEGLAEAHGLGVVHRDLKPQNVMLDKEGNAKIMDFGVARTIKARGITEEETIIGTPEYMSPEQVEGEAVDPRSDIYSLGIILFEMVTGRVPFEGETPLSIAVKHKSEPPPIPREINPQIPEDFSRMILRCLEKDKTKRYQSAEELASVLNKIEKGVPTTDRLYPRRRTKKISRIPWKKTSLYAVPALFLILLIVAGIYFLTGRGEAIDSIAVLPLKNLSGNPNHEYLADGMTEALISNLTQISALQRVISSTSVMRYKGVSKTLPEIAQELNVDAVVEGSVLVSEQRVRVTALLIDARSDRNLWSRSYERSVSDILALQNELARAIAKEVKIIVTPAEQALLARKEAASPEVYQIYVRGRHFWNKRTLEDLSKAIEQFEQAIALDPNYALAYVGLADAYNMLGSYDLLSPLEAFPKAKTAAQKALEIDDALAEAYTSLAFVKYRFDLDWFGAETDFNWAIGLNPSYANAHQWYGALLRDMGRLDEAMMKMRRAQELDPLSLPINTSIGYLLYLSRQYDQAIEQCNKVLEVDEEFAWVYDVLGLIYAQKPQFEEAIAAFENAVNYSGGSAQYLTDLAYGYAASGQKEKALEMIKELQDQPEQKYIPPYELACVYAALDEKDTAIQLLRRAYRERSSGIHTAKMDPRLDGLRADPGFTALMEEMGLE